MWLILLDASGSMADPFANATSFSGRQRATLAQNKIDAAKEALILHLQGLGEATQIAIFAFRSIAELIYEGSSADIARIETVLDGIRAGNGTDIAAALKAARDRADFAPNHLLFRVLLISDGLSDPIAAEVVGKELLSKRIPIDVILIDPSEEGNELARRAAGSYGSVTAVTSASEMATAVGDAGSAMRATAAAVEQAQASLRRATTELRADGQQGEEVSFTAAYPSELEKDRWASLLVFIHLLRLSEEARNRAMGLGQTKGSDQLSATVRASSRLPRGTDITLTPRLPGFDVNPSSTTIAWHEDIQDFEFRIRPTDSIEGPIIGEVEVSARGLPIGRVPISILIHPAKTAESAGREPAINTGGVFQTIFASHAREDEQVVRACAAVYAGLGIYVVIDKQALIAGQSWRPAIRALLAGSDVFQLFWSKAASVSPPVADEISDALVIQGDRGTGFIRPVFWVEPPTPMPRELKHINFVFLDLERLGGTCSEKTSATGRPKPLKGSRNIPVTVLPLLPNTSAGVTHEIRVDVAFAIEFIEDTVGSRYYPVPTLLVDHHTVQTVREVETVDYTRVEHDRHLALEDRIEILGSVCLDFHMRHFWPESSWEAANQTADQIGLDPTAFRELLWRSEVVKQWFKEPESGWVYSRDTLVKAKVPGISGDQGFLEFADVFFGTVAKVLRRRSREVRDLHVEGKYWISSTAWERLSASGITRGLRAMPVKGDDHVLMAGSIDGFISALEGAWTSAKELIPVAMRAGPSQFFVADLPTYGIFIPANATGADAQVISKAHEWDLPQALFLPSTDRVLLCGDALDDFQAILRKSGNDANAARLFLRSILVHEHFHAFARTAPMDDGSSPAGPGYQKQWIDASPVNEAIAAWMQIHVSRDDAIVSERVWDYIGSGVYPNWPYAGAAVVEKAYQEKGSDEVRALIRLLRTDPPLAVSWMTKAIATQNQSGGKPVVRNIRSRLRGLNRGRATS